eukprot:GHUV01029238.1.p2 GENE.GHUV01029238.1~~GHUV01029238.1.p2  ORF type:complete len:102 (-),score=19.14 GHUV01029238.1:125-430(-)
MTNKGRCLKQLCRVYQWQVICVQQQNLARKQEAAVAAAAFSTQHPLSAQTESGERKVVGLSSPSQIPGCLVRCAWHKTSISGTALTKLSSIFPAGITARCR